MTTRSTDRPAGDVHFHWVHGHYHFDGFAQSALWATDAAGNRIGSGPVATGDKVSFCIADTAIDPTRWGTKLGFAPTTYPAPNCLDPRFSQNGRDYYIQGMSSGHADRYDWYLPGQYIDVSHGVSDGVYLMDTTVDPTGRFVEADTNNNCTSVKVRLTGMGTSTPQAELLGSYPACAPR